MTTNRGPEVPWVAACTLPTAERPLRLAEFDALFSTVLREVRRPEATRLRLTLDGGQSVEASARELTARESECCSFFGWQFSRVGEHLVLEVTVPESQIEVLDGLTDRARAGLAS
jgi:hypothetical protein